MTFLRTQGWERAGQRHPLGFGAAFALAQGVWVAASLGLTSSVRAVPRISFSLFLSFQGGVGWIWALSGGGGGLMNRGACSGESVGGRAKA